MTIRLATEKDIPNMRKIFNAARDYQLKTGFTQWAEGYPAQELILKDIEKEAAYVYLNEADEIIGVLSVFTEPDPTYTYIEGEWLNEQPYATIHRIATAQNEKGVGQYLMRWVQEQHANIRIDTHKENKPMKHILDKLGYFYTGVIYIENGEARDAFHYVRETE